MFREGWVNIKHLKKLHKNVKTINHCKIAKSYNDTCTENEQCMPLLGDKATCIDEKCACDESLHFKNGNCHEKKGIS